MAQRCSRIKSSAVVSWKGLAKLSGGDKSIVCIVDHERKITSSKILKHYCFFRGGFYRNLQREPQQEKCVFCSSLSIEFFFFSFLFFVSSNRPRAAHCSYKRTKRNNPGQASRCEREWDKRPVMWGGFPLATHLPSVPTPQDACEPSCVRQRTRAAIRFVETTKQSHVARPGSLPGGVGGVDHSTLRRVSQDSTWHENVLLFMSSKKKKNLKQGHQIFTWRWQEGDSTLT